MSCITYEDAHALGPRGVLAVLHALCPSFHSQHGVLPAHSGPISLDRSHVADRHQHCHASHLPQLQLMFAMCCWHDAFGLCPPLPLLLPLRSSRRACPRAEL